MPEQKIVIEIDENGKISAETFGIKGEVCMEELQEILGDAVGDIDSITKTDEYYQKANQQVLNKQKAGLR